MAIGYSCIAIAASSHKIISQGVSIVSEDRGTDSVTQTFGMANAVGSVLFAFGGLSTMPEIQSTLPSPSKPVMMKGVTMAYALAMLLYCSVAAFGYLAFGNSVKDNILVSTAKPDWLVAIANAMVVVHVVAGYQVYSMIVFMLAERKLEESLKFYKTNWCTRLLGRSIFVILGVMVAAYIPFFGAVNGFVGAAGIAMITFIIPVLLSLIYFKNAIKLQWRVLSYLLIVIVFLLSVFAIAGTLHNIIIQKQK
eukprot:TRINITY_DN2741_c0_g1_i6.p2 TRINITY_DN2741_c0_g1~~TRINITY_DN2741_c0_g1_i6.p2  ORF type:complete len:251 (+),score=32.72 TRINITY_DN2741_c0_g1_i6:1-753(+)